MKKYKNMDKDNVNSKEKLSMQLLNKLNTFINNHYIKYIYDNKPFSLKKEFDKNEIPPTRLQCIISILNLLNTFTIFLMKHDFININNEYKILVKDMIK